MKPVGEVCVNCVAFVHDPLDEYCSPPFSDDCDEPDILPLVSVKYMLIDEQGRAMIYFRGYELKDAFDSKDYIAAKLMTWPAGD